MSFKRPSVSKKELQERLEQSNVLIPRITAAIECAQRAHKNQKRDNGNPYLEEHIYPIAFAVVDRYKNDPDLENILILGILHDVLEDDPNASPTDIEQRFGQEMLAHLLLLTKKPEENIGALSEAEKMSINARILQKLENAPRSVQIVKLEDRLNNFSCIEKVDTEKSFLW